MSIIYLAIGFLLGFIVCSLSAVDLINSKNETIDDLKKSVELHNQRELRLVYINQSIKRYVKQKQTILKSVPIMVSKVTDEDSVQAGKYMALKDLEKTINQLEKENF